MLDKREHLVRVRTLTTLSLIAKIILRFLLRCFSNERRRRAADRSAFSFFFSEDDRPPTPTRRRHTLRCLARAMRHTRSASESVPSWSPCHSPATPDYGRRSQRRAEVHRRVHARDHRRTVRRRHHRHRHFQRSLQRAHPRRRPSGPPAALPGPLANPEAAPLLQGAPPGDPRQGAPPGDPRQGAPFVPPPRTRTPRPSHPATARSRALRSIRVSLRRPCKHSSASAFARPRRTATPSAESSRTQSLATRLTPSPVSARTRQRQTKPPRTSPPPRRHPRPGTPRRIGTSSRERYPHRPRERHRRSDFLLDHDRGGGHERRFLPHLARNSPSFRLTRRPSLPR